MQKVQGSHIWPSGLNISQHDGGIEPSWVQRVRDIEPSFQRACDIDPYHDGFKTMDRIGSAGEWMRAGEKLSRAQR